LKLLCVADMHLGRVPSRLHEELYEQVADLGPAAAWRRAVDLALTEQVAAVLLAGDLVDGGNDFFEAFSDLREGVLRLTQAGVQVVAVAGNHDPEVLARLVQVVPQVRLLGAGGVWETLDLAGADGSYVRLVGWSFPNRWFNDSPLADDGLVVALERAGATAAAGGSSVGDSPSDTSPSGAAPVAAGPEVAGGRPLVTIGLLHTDRDQSGSRYAPVTSAQLGAAAVDAWLLGHVHVPDVGLADGLAAGRGYVGGYLGSLSSNDPGEAGARGAWLLEVAPSGAISFEHVRLAPLRWEQLELDVSGWQAPEEFQPGLISSLEELGETLLIEGARPLAVGCRLRLVGRTPYRAEIERLLGSAPPSARLIEVAGMRFFVDEVRLDALPPVDLGELARQDDPVGLLVARIVALRSPGSELRERLVAAAAPRLAEINGRSDFGGGAVPAPDAEEVAALLEEAATSALDALLAQPNGGGGAR